MPFTLAHPAVVLVTPKTKFLHKPGLIIGSMSPDFIYYLLGAPTSKVGHTVFGCLTLNLWLCFAVFYLYHWFIAPYFWQHLPNFVTPNIPLYHQPHQSIAHFLIFCCSAFIGMMTHIVLDLYTHAGSTVVKNSSWLGLLFGNDTVSLPVYKWFQYGGGIIGMFFILCYLLYHARLRNRLNKTDAISNQPIGFSTVKYWVYFTCIAVVMAVLWQLFDGIDRVNHATVVKIVIRGVDILFISLVIVGMLNLKKFGQIKVG